MEPFFQPDPTISSVKGLVFLGDKFLVYRRDTNTPLYPLYLDLPGGGAEAGETPFQTFQREVKEEFGLTIPRGSIIYARKYPSATIPGTFGYFPVAKLPATAQHHITFGDEGLRYTLMTASQFLARSDAIDFLQQRVSDYMKTVDF